MEIYEIKLNKSDIKYKVMVTLSQTGERRPRFITCAVNVRKFTNRPFTLSLNVLIK